MVSGAAKITKYKKKSLKGMVKKKILLPVQKKKKTVFC
jgi:hypothetical protein